MALPIKSLSRGQSLPAIPCQSNPDLHARVSRRYLPHIPAFHKLSPVSGPTSTEQRRASSPATPSETLTGLHYSLWLCTDRLNFASPPTTTTTHHTHPPHLSPTAPSEQTDCWLAPRSLLPLPN
ncbi:forkhead box protein B1a [Lates japonicus]|uniref:Forkhead box protein B1a n=1 Tax=Lates japonicus TaxID=270547 RepID=A0AAD3R630_LATJO|nr:forkhead box protein B1a [Lates japonicus]